MKKGTMGLAILYVAKWVSKLGVEQRTCWKKKNRGNRPSGKHKKIEMGGKGALVWTCEVAIEGGGRKRAQKGVLKKLPVPQKKKGSVEHKVSIKPTSPY